MKKYILLLALICANATGYANGIDSLYNTKTAHAETVIVDSKRPTTLHETGKVVKVISKTEINNMPVSGIHDLLNTVMNIDVRKRGAMDVQSDISIRGGNFDQVMILLNGINITDPQTGHYAANIPIDFKSIERIEVLDFASGNIAGAGAFSGAINFITATGDENKANISYSAGDFAYSDISINSSVSTGKVRHYLAANMNSSDGYIDNTDFDAKNLYYMAKYNDMGFNVDFQAGYSDKAYGANSFYSASFPDQYDENTTMFSSLKLSSVSEDISYYSDFYYRRHIDRFELFRDEAKAASWYTHHNNHLTDVYGADASITINSNYFATSAGFALRSENIMSNVLGNATGDTIDALKQKHYENLMSDYYDKKFSRVNVSLYLNEKFTYKDISISAGFLLATNTMYFNELEFLPNLGITYTPCEKISIYSSVSKSRRMPTFTDLFYSGPSNVGNKDLKPEEALNYLLGSEYKSEYFVLKGNIFYRQGSNIIDWVKTDGEKKYRTMNMEDINTMGADISLMVDFQKNDWQLLLLAKCLIDIFIYRSRK
jgi:iron complex outermembrane receptor protein